MRTRTASSAHDAAGRVDDVLHSPGQPLEAATRSFMESRFGHDFSGVRVHTDAHAAASARSVDALGYTVGNHVVFGAGQYAPQTHEGRTLLAHELTHVMQQRSADIDRAPLGVSHPGDALELAADATAETVVRGSAPVSAVGASRAPLLFRRVGRVNCPPNVFGAPADPRAALEAIDLLAVAQANAAADALTIDANDTATSGMPAAPSVTFAAYRDNFGLPGPAGRGFLNRLTGRVRGTQAAAASEELRILSRRFRMSARLFTGTVNYRCPGNAAATLPGCAEGSCGDSFAFSCRGGATIGLCDPFWSTLSSDADRGTALVHESMHIIFGDDAAPLQGTIGETTQSGSGRNFNVAGCYELIINAQTGSNTFAVCPPVPPA